MLYSFSQLHKTMDMGHIWKSWWWYINKSLRQTYISAELFCQIPANKSCGKWINELWGSLLWYLPVYQAFCSAWICSSLPTMTKQPVESYCCILDNWNLEVIWVDLVARRGINATHGLVRNLCRFQIFRFFLPFPHCLFFSLVYILVLSACHDSQQEM